MCKHALLLPTLQPAYCAEHRVHACYNRNCLYSWFGNVEFAEAPCESGQPGGQMCKHALLLPPVEAGQHISGIAGRADRAVHVLLLVVCSWPSRAAHT